MNTAKTAALMTGLTVLLVLAGGAFGGRQWMVFAFIMAIGMRRRVSRFGGGRDHRERVGVQCHADGVPSADGRSRGVFREGNGRVFFSGDHIYPDTLHH